MRRLPRPLTIAIGLIVVALVAIGIVVAVRRDGSGSGSTSSSSVTIPAGGGVELAAKVTEPASGRRSALVVMPAPWGSTAAGYDPIAVRLAERGFTVVAYTQRGFRDSGGRVDFMGPATQADARTVIDWALAHTSVDRHRIGMMGISYGAGASLLAAEHDPRIRAVVALSTWTDFGFSFAPHGTLATAALDTLLASARRSGRLDRQATRLAGQLHSRPAAAIRTVRAMSAVRSPSTDLVALNRHDTAVMLANAWEDSIFSPDQVVDFYRKLRTPKRLQLAPGDHGGPELAALNGLPDPTVGAGIAWLDHYLYGARNHVARAGPVRLQDIATGAWHSYRRWPVRTTPVQLARPGRPGDVGTVASAWRASLQTGVDSGAASGPTMFLSSAQYSPPTLAVSAVSGAHAFVWSGPATRAPTVLAGTPRLHLSLSSPASKVSLFAYLYDVVPDGTGRLMSFTPYTATGPAGRAYRVTIALRPIRWTVPAGDHVELVLDSVDARYRSAAPAGTVVTAASIPSRQPAELDVPLSR